MSAGKRKPIEDFVEEIDYPESDGEPMAETDPHIQQIIDLRSSLRDFFRNTKQVYVGSNLLLYYVEGDPGKCVAPDVFVVRGVGKQSRRTYKLWEEKRAPNVVIEVSSRKTKKEDLGWKKQLYAWLDVKEYFIFDPEYKLKPPFRAFRLRGRDYVEEAVTGGRARSDELKLELVNTGKDLRLFDPKTGRFLLTPEENADARREAEGRADNAEAEIQRLLAELAQLKKEPANGKRRKS
ncbi:MAG: Uma2 family endonuclease [Blastocatellia bacterium]